MSEECFLSEGLKLGCRFYPVQNARGVCMTLHGHGEHAGRYQKFQKVLESENISYAVFEYRGQGRSEGRDVSLDTIEDYLADASAFRKFLEERYGIREKIILHGNSLGGLVAIYWALRYPEQVRALVLTSPCLGLKLPKALETVNALFNRFLPDFIFRNPVYPPHLTHSPEEMELYKRDPMIKRRISARLVHEMMAQGRRLETFPRFDFPFPVYMMLAGLEKVVDSSKAMLFFEKVNAPEKQVKLFPEFYHELFHEKDQDLAFETLREYMRRISGKTER